MNFAPRAVFLVTASLAPGAFVAALVFAEGVDLNWEKITTVGLLGVFAALIVKGIIVPGIYYNDAKVQAKQVLTELDQQRETARQAVVAMQKMVELVERVGKIKDQIDGAVVDNRHHLDELKQALAEHRKQARRHWAVLQKIADTCKIVVVDGDEDQPPQGN